jgi:AAA domain-containing protein/DNA primase RepB-like protein
MSASNTALYKAQDLWDHVFGDERGLLAICHTEGPNFRTNYFAYPKAADKAAEWTLEKAQDGHEVYFCAHLLAEPRRIKENATEVHTLWGDLDGAKLPEGEITPTAAVQSSPDRFHCYWRLADGIPPQAAELLNKRLALQIGADPSGFDLTQLLRVPGTANYKYEGRSVVGIQYLDASRTYSAGDLDRILPPLPEAASTNDHTLDHARALHPDEPPVELGPEALKVWRGEKPKAKDTGEVDRSASLMKIGRVIYDAGATRRTVVEALRERDTALGWKCYTNRRDADKQYQAIADKLEDEGRTHFIPITGNRNSHSHSRIGDVNVNESENGTNHHPKRSLRAVSFVGRAKPPPQEFVVEKLIPCGLATSFYGGGGLAKSVNVLHLGMSVAFVGVESWHGLEVMTCPVVYLDFEMSETVQLRRAKEIADGVGWADVPRGFHYVEAAGYSAADVFSFALELVEEHGPALVIVDSFGFSMQGESERSADVLGYVRNYIQPLQDTGSHTLVVDHIARAIKGERVADKEAFGSVYKTNAMRSTVNVTGHADEDAGTVYATFTHRKNNVGPRLKPFTVVTKFSAGAIAFERSDTVIHPPTEDTVEQLIVAALREDGPMTNKQIAANIDRDLRSVQNSTSRLKSAGVLVETGKKVDREAVLELAAQ